MHPDSGQVWHNRQPRHICRAANMGCCPGLPLRYGLGLAVSARRRFFQLLQGGKRVGLGIAFDSWIQQGRCRLADRMARSQRQRHDELVFHQIEQIELPAANQHVFFEFFV